MILAVNRIASYCPICLNFPQTECIVNSKLTCINNHIWCYIWEKNKIILYYTLNNSKDNWIIL